MVWKLVADEPQDIDAPVNAFFRQLYLMVADLLTLPSQPLFDFEAHEHTAQVDAAKRTLLEVSLSILEKGSGRMGKRRISRCAIGAPAGFVLLAYYGTRRRYFCAQYGLFAQCSANTSELCAT